VKVVTLNSHRSVNRGSFEIVQITDCHLGGAPGDCLLGLNTDESLRDVLEQARAHTKPNLLLATGDISGDGSFASYQRFLSITKQYFPDVPLAWLPGNHDELDNMVLASRDVAGNTPIERVFRTSNWNLLFLDSTVPEEDGGEINPSELKRLESELSQHPDVPTLIFLHHQPVAVGSAWVDSYIVKNHREFFRVIDKFDNVKGISWGHVHQEFYVERKGVPLMASPSTCVQFAPNVDYFKIDNRMPGYRNYRLNSNGTFATDTCRVQDKSYNIDYSSTGY